MIKQPEIVRRIMADPRTTQIAIMLTITFFMLWVAQVKLSQNVCEIACVEKGGHSAGFVFSCGCAIPKGYQIDYEIKMPVNETLNMSPQDWHT